METTWIDQRNNTDCAVCCVAMALDVPYERAMEAALSVKAYCLKEGTSSVYKILEALGLSYRFLNGKPIGDMSAKSRAYHISPEYFLDTLWGRPAIITAKSRNGASYHAVFYDGEMLYDPSTRERYTDFWSLEDVTDAVVFAPHFRDAIKR